MAFCCCRRCEELGDPFLRDGFSSQSERWQAIAAEAEAYLAGGGGVETLEMPDCLYWLLRVEHWGPICAGGQIDQPHHFLQDLEWAAVGRTRARRATSANAAISAAETRREIKALNAQLAKAFQGV